MRSLALLWLSIFAITLPACSLFKSSKADSSKEKPAAEGPELIGRIASVPAGKRFVLIQSYGSWKIETGTILTTCGLEDRSANLLVTGETLGQFAAADVQSGSVDVGDAVYFHRISKPTDSPADPDSKPELSENQQEVKSENVQKNN